MGASVIQAPPSNSGGMSIGDAFHLFHMFEKRKPHEEAGKANDVLMSIHTNHLGLNSKLLEEEYGRLSRKPEVSVPYKRLLDRLTSLLYNI